jgi:hypothetical protein
MVSFLTALGAGLGVALLLIMALAPALDALPLPRREPRADASRRAHRLPVGLHRGPGARRAA